MCQNANSPVTEAESAPEKHAQVRKSAKKPSASPPPFDNPSLNLYVDSGLEGRGRRRAAIRNSFFFFDHMLTAFYQGRLERMKRSQVSSFFFKQRVVEAMCCVSHRYRVSISVDVFSCNATITTTGMYLTHPTLLLYAISL